MQLRSADKREKSDGNDAVEGVFTLQRLLAGLIGRPTEGSGDALCIDPLNTRILQRTIDHVGHHSTRAMPKSGREQIVHRTTPATHPLLNTYIAVKSIPRILHT
jgi:hypothetical protein